MGSFAALISSRVASVVRGQSSVFVKGTANWDGMRGRRTAGLSASKTDGLLYLLCDGHSGARLYDSSIEVPWSWGERRGEWWCRAKVLSDERCEVRSGACSPASRFCLAARITTHRVVAFSHSARSALLPIILSQPPYSHRADSLRNGQDASSARWQDLLGYV
jgi:hypothetical protein